MNGSTFGTGHIVGGNLGINRETSEIPFSRPFPKKATANIEEMMGRIPRPLRIIGAGAAVCLGGIFTLSLVSSVTIRTLQAAAEAKRKKVALPCTVCKGRGYYICKLCKGNSTIEWSPLYDPIVINPCVCPTCEGNRVQRCLNCIGKGYV
ncbi:hypothetical protein MRB53_004857 [Persea americana]|uniref:Uncharacterized protein n=1 Tax=Persea americana TaxID=3435 RepID=A0ACC2MCP4_PERAE|nr:hypothetical protein MRB53_004857 [Persea americana]